MIKLEIAYFLKLIVLSLKSHECYTLRCVKTQRTVVHFLLLLGFRIAFPWIITPPAPQRTLKCSSVIFSGSTVSKTEHGILPLDMLTHNLNHKLALQCTSDWAESILSMGGWGLSGHLQVLMIADKRDLQNCSLLVVMALVAQVMSPAVVSSPAWFWVLFLSMLPLNLVC